MRWNESDWGRIRVEGFRYAHEPTFMSAYDWIENFALIPFRLWPYLFGMLDLVYLTRAVYYYIWIVISN